MERLEKDDDKLEDRVVNRLEYDENRNFQEEVTVGAITKPRFRWPEDVSTTHEPLENICFTTLMFKYRG